MDGSRRSDGSEEEKKRWGYKLLKNNVYVIYFGLFLSFFLSRRLCRGVMVQEISDRVEQGQGSMQGSLLSSPLYFFIIFQGLRGRPQGPRRRESASRRDTRITATATTDRTHSTELFRKEGNAELSPPVDYRPAPPAETDRF